jgi:hypothetical protein
VTLLYNPQTTHRHHWPDIILNALRPGAIAQCNSCQQHAELRLVMFDQGEALVWMEISAVEAASKVLSAEKEIPAEEARLRRRVEELEAVLRQVEHTRPSAYPDEVWSMIVKALHTTW